MAGGVGGVLVGKVVMALPTGGTPESVAAYTLSCADAASLVHAELFSVGCVFADDSDSMTTELAAGRDTFDFSVKRPSAGQGRVVVVLSAAGRVSSVVSIDISPRSAMPSGVIVMWSGLLTAIPSGWALCDGTSGTPDLRDRFIRGAAAGADPGATGGAASASYTPAGTVSAPTFTGSAITDTTKVASGTTSVAVLASPKTPAGTVSAPAFTGTTAPIATVPPYYALAFIMKL